MHAYACKENKFAVAMNNVTIPLNRNNIATVYVSKYTCAIKVNKQDPGATCVDIHISVQNFLAIAYCIFITKSTLIN